MNHANTVTLYNMTWVLYTCIQRNEVNFENQAMVVDHGMTSSVLLHQQPPTASPDRVHPDIVSQQALQLCSTCSQSSQSKMCSSLSAAAIQDALECWQLLTALCDNCMPCPHEGKPNWLPILCLLMS